MQPTNVYLIAAAEVAALLLLCCVFLIIQNRSLRNMVRKLRARMEQLVIDLKAARSAAPKSEQATEANGHSYKQMLNKQLDFVREYHERQDAGQDILLDLDPETPLSRRVAALRYAVLQAEKEATAHKLNDHADWTLLQSRYEKLFDFQNTYAQDSASADESEELEALHSELNAAKKRVQNLERFKALYFDLEQQWESSKESAQAHMTQISELASDAENSQQIENVLRSYEQSYNELGAMIEAGVEGQDIITSSTSANDHRSSEIRRLQSVAADQHKIITELQRKLRDADTTEAAEQIVNELQGQLQKQTRFVQESETCIQLLEDELNTTHKELEQLQARMSKLPELKTVLLELRSQNDEYELQIASMRSENRRLSDQLQQAGSAPASDNGDAQELKKELAELSQQYAELEEKFLDLKMGG